MRTSRILVVDDKLLAEKIKKGYLRSKGVTTESCQLDILAPSPSNKRNMPNDIARSSLFVTKAKGVARKAIKHQRMFHLHKDISIVYTGEELRADDDEIIWMEILNFSQTVKLGEPFEFNISSLVKAIGWPHNGNYYEKIRQSISRLKTTEILFKNPKAHGVSSAFSLIQKYDVINDEQAMPSHYRMYLDPEIVLLFVNKNFSQHEWEAYRKLSPVARRLADYTQSHKTPHPLDILDFHSLCGSDNNNLASWKQKTKKAIGELSDVGIIANGQIVDNKIYVIRPTSRDLSDMVV
jgi:hypothetical protein